MPTAPLRLRLLNDYPVILAGVRAMLAPFASDVQIVEEDVQTDSDRHVDLTLFDTFGNPEADRDALDAVLADPRAGAVVVYSWNLHPSLVQMALAKGCRGYLDKRLPTAELVDALMRIAAGRTLALELSDPDADAVDPPEAIWPGKSAGLSVREAEVIALITQGITNAEIASRVYISMNSLKSLIRSAYRKMGVERRSQAVRWGIEHELRPPQSH